MSLHKYDISVECPQCVCTSTNQKDGFEVTVPIRDTTTGVSGQAVLHCSVTPDNHKVKLLDCVDDESRQVSLDQESTRRLSRLLEFISVHRICGNESICPHEVSRIVKQLSS